MLVNLQHIGVFLAAFHTLAAKLLYHRDAQTTLIFAASIAAYLPSPFLAFRKPRKFLGGPTIR